MMYEILPFLTALLLKSAIVLLVALVAVLFMRRSSAAARHLVWTGAVAGVLALPVLSFLLPGWSAAPGGSVPRISQIAPSAFEESFSVEAWPAEPGIEESVAASGPAVPESVGDGSQSVATPPVGAGVTERRDEALPVGTAAGAGTNFSLSAAFWEWAPWIWLGGALFALLPLVLGASGLFRLKRTARRVKDPAWLSLLAELSSELKVGRKVLLLESPVCTMPMTWGALPGLPAKIVVPEDALDDWTSDRRRAVLLHELAHVKRRDCLTQTLSQFACALYWPNPFIWVAAHRMLVERERACDDLALRNAMQPSEYAKHLLEIATGQAGSPLARHAAVAMARPSGLGNRLVAVLDQRRNRKSLSRVAAVAAIAFLGAVVVPVAMLQAEGAEEETSDEEAIEVAESFPEMEAIFVPLDEERGSEWLAHRYEFPEEGLTLSGRVVDPEGRPVPDVTVRLGNEGVLPGRNGNPPEHSARSAVTDERGRFEFDTMLPGRTSVWAVDEREGGSVSVGWVRHLETGAQNVTVTLEPLASELVLAGRVVDADGQPVSGTRMYLRNILGEPDGTEAETISDEKGLFRFRLPMPDVYTSRHLFLIGQSPDGDLAWKTVSWTSANDLTLVVQPTVRVTGQVVGPEGEAVAGAFVRPQHIFNHHAGTVPVTGALRDQVPGVHTDDEGSFVFPGIPAYGFVDFQVDHEDYGEGWERVDVGGEDTTLERPILMDPPIIIEGIVRRERDRAPLQGATVTLNRGASVETDEDGRFRFGGLTRWDVTRGSTTVMADWEREGERLVGSQVIRETLERGDHVRGLEIELEIPLEVYRDAWLAHPGDDRPSRYNVAVLHDADPEYRGKSEYQDTIAVFDGEGNVVWDYVGLNVTQMIRPEGWLSLNPGSGELWVNDAVSRRLIRFDEHGRPNGKIEELRLSDEIEDARAGAIAVDRSTGHLWVLTSSVTIHGEDLVVLDRDGSEVARHDVAGGSLQFSPFDESLWIIGEHVIRMNRSGEVLFQSEPFPWTAVAMDVDPDTGWLWVVEGAHPNVAGSRPGLHGYTPDGERRISISFEAGHARGGVVVDPHLETVWTLGDQLRQWDTYDGALLNEFPISGSSLAIEPDTGYLWVGSSERLMRLDRQGRPVWVHRTEGGSQKWLLTVPDRGADAPEGNPVSATERILRDRARAEIERRRAERDAIRGARKVEEGEADSSGIQIDGQDFEAIRSAFIAQYAEPRPPREYTYLPVGSEAPDIEMVRFGGEESVRLSDLRGKIVLLEFWASWCGPCQEPMAKLQALVEEHPEWEGQVEIITLSIDEERATAAAHLESNGWNRTLNMWAGPGEWESNPAEQFNLEAVPSYYLVDRDGRIHQVGNPWDADFSAAISALLE